MLGERIMSLDKLNEECYQYIGKLSQEVTHLEKDSTSDTLREIDTNKMDGRKKMYDFDEAEMMYIFSEDSVSSEDLVGITNLYRQMSGDWMHERLIITYEKSIVNSIDLI